MFNKANYDFISDHQLSIEAQLNEIKRQVRNNLANIRRLHPEFANSLLNVQTVHNDLRSFKSQSIDLNYPISLDYE